MAKRKERISEAARPECDVLHTADYPRTGGVLPTDTLRALLSCCEQKPNNGIVSKWPMFSATDSKRKMVAGRGVGGERKQKEEKKGGKERETENKERRKERGRKGREKYKGEMKDHPASSGAVL